MTTGLFWMRDGVIGAGICWIIVGGALSTIEDIVGVKTVRLMVCFGVNLLFFLCYGFFMAALTE